MVMETDCSGIMETEYQMSHFFAILQCTYFRRQSDLPVCTSLLSCVNLNCVTISFSQDRFVHPHLSVCMFARFVFEIKGSISNNNEVD